MSSLVSRRTGAATVSVLLAAVALFPLRWGWV